MSGALRWRAATVLVLGIGLLLAGGEALVPGTVASRATAPNIVVILTDDQRFDTLWSMPAVQSDLVDHGVTFSNGFVVNSLCCPSRASILTGEYSHSTGVYHIQPPNGGFSDFDDSSTLATWLHGAGYRTGLIGKYLDGYDGPDTHYIPPGWDTWFAFTSTTGNGDYFDYTVSDNGVSKTYGNAETDYSTDVLASQADSFIRGANQSQPLFLYFAPKAPHEPATPAPRDVGSFSNLPPYRPPSYNEDDVSDKPAYIQATHKLSAQDIADEDQFRIDQYETLQAADDAVAEIVAALTDTGRLSNTMIVFTSDNGLMWGEHRRTAKMVPYQESIRIPMVIRYDPLTTAPKTDDHLVANIDLAPTVAEIAGVQAPGAEGMSMVPLLGPAAVSWREDFLVEHMQAWDDVPTYCTLRNSGFVFTVYGTGERELYDLAADPYEQTNVAHDTGYASTIAGMWDELATLCNPPPPNFKLCTVTGTSGNDTLTGTSGDDVLCGLGGDDTFIGSAGDDIFVGGDGTDTVSFMGAAKAVTVNLATNSSTGQGKDILLGVENITGSLHDDTLTGDDGANVIRGQGGADTITRTSGDDTLYGNAGPDAIYGGGDDDSIYGGNDADSLFGNSADDYLDGGNGNDDLDGGLGTDTCVQGPGTGSITHCEH
jgi:N-acetylglucosamine-6-sulfatase